MRIILYLGKGGVGKTTVSAATAVRSARLGKRTLVVSTDLAHSLADCLRVPLTSEPQELETNLWAQEVNALDEMRRGWGKLQDSMSKVLRKQGIDSVMAEELALIPGMDEIVSLINIYRNARGGNGVSVVNSGDFARGRFGNVNRMTGDQLRQASLVRGQVPIAPTRESLRVSDRATGAIPRNIPGNNVGGGRFFSHTQPVGHAP